MRGRTVALMLVMLTAVVPVMPAGADHSGDATEQVEFSHELDLETGTATTTVTFEGAGHFRELYPSDDYWIPGAGVQFPEWRSAERGPFSNNPSGKTILFWMSGPSADVCFAEAVHRVSLFYSTTVPARLDGFDQDGHIIAQAFGPPNAESGFHEWHPLAVEIPTDVITCIRLYGRSVQTAIDDLAFSRQVLLPVDIQVGAGNGHARLPPSGHGSVEVAILAADDIDPVAEVDASTLTFGKTGDEASLQRCLQPRDVDRDGRDDLVCRFDMAETGLGPTDGEAVLKGARVDGFPLRGSDAVGFAQDRGGR